MANIQIDNKVRLETLLTYSEKKNEENQDEFEIIFTERMVKTFCSSYCTNDFNPIHNKSKVKKIKDYPFNGPIVPLMLLATYAEVVHNYKIPSEQRMSGLKMGLKKEVYFDDPIKYIPKTKRNSLGIELQKDQENLGKASISVTQNLEDAVIGPEFELTKELQMKNYQVKNYLSAVEQIKYGAAEFLKDFVLRSKKELKTPRVFWAAATASQTLLEIGKKNKMPPMMYGTLNIDFYKGVEDIRTNQQIKIFVNQRDTSKYDVAAADKNNRMIFKLRTRLFPL